jgi:hypothetical protein
MPAPLLLHAAQGTVETAAAGGSILIVGALVAGACAGALLGALSRRLLSAQTLAAAVWLLAAVAIAQSVVPYDHMLEIAPHGHETVHASHCHDTPASCADAPVTAGPGQLLTAEPLLPAPALALTLLLVTSSILYGVVYRPDTRPPMPLARVPTPAS